MTAASGARLPLAAHPALARLVFGGAPIGGLYPPVSDEAAAATLEAAWDAGIRAFDTAPHYGVGLSERLIGDFLAGRPRQEFGVAPRSAGCWCPRTEPLTAPRVLRRRTAADQGPRLQPRRRARARWRTACAGSRLDRVDIALIHDPDDHMAAGAGRGLPGPGRAARQGVIGAIGVGMNSRARSPTGS